ncbi:MAG: hypothetical protein PHF97_12500, partial [Bacteroidales bacterium]|nr:hypothetical protein [Bacteroidales bacterium]
SPLCLSNILNEKYKSNGVILIPEKFSILDKPEESYLMLKKLISALFLEGTRRVMLNYENCNYAALSSQILLDIILKDYFQFAKRCHKAYKGSLTLFPSIIGGENINNKNIQKMLFSVGSPAILGINEKSYKDIIKYKLCIHNNEKEMNLERRMAQKEIDTTELADYVISSLARMNKQLTLDKINDLCTVIGEILINAEEHSTTKYRFSIGYFKEEMEEGKHFGVFRLVILNFGDTIYDKFKSEDCPNKDIVQRMKELSKSYTSKSLFSRREFEEENLWTLYALQEGVTSVSYDRFQRGNGSIRFIESFFNLKDPNDQDDMSMLSILSGRTRIIFDGKYKIESKTNNKGTNFKVMTFNDSGDIENKPDSKYVFCTDDYFPGTLISAKILLNDMTNQIN